MKEFVPFAKINRSSKEFCVVTEKIDGTNAQIYITEDEEPEFLIGSRSRWIIPGDDNYGFAAWAMEHKEELLMLGPGPHFGEWWGPGIQRRYFENEKRFSLFDVMRWGAHNPPPACCSVVPELFRGKYSDFNSDAVMAALRMNGSYASPGFMNPEGIVIYQMSSRTRLKRTFDYDETGKGDNR